MTSALFWERLQATGLASPEVCRQWAKEIEAAQGKENSGDPLKIASALLRSGKLTPFQLNCISETHPPSLVVGPYRLIDTLSDRLGPNWFEAVHVTQNTKKWCLQLRPDQLCAPETKNWPPSIELGKAHKVLECSFLDRWESVVAGQGTLSCFGDPVSGKPLSQYLQDGPLSVEDSSRVVLQIAEALQTLHSNKLVHGNVSTRLCWYDGANCTLRRNILFVPASPYSASEDWVFKKDEQDRWMSAAPEFVLPDAKPSPQTDLYALGILWLQLLNRESTWKRYGSLDALGWKKIHTQESPEIPKGLPEPIVSFVKSLLAKNPAARCKTAATLHSKLLEWTTLGQSDSITKRTAANIPQRSVASSESSTVTPLKAPSKQSPTVPTPDLLSPAPAKSSPRQHLLQPTLAAGNTCRNQHWQHATPAATNTGSRQHLPQPALAAGNTCCNQHFLQQATPAATNTGSRQHLLQPTLAAGNTCRNQHWQHLATPAATSTGSRQHLLQPTLSAAGNTCCNQHWQQATPAATSTGSRQHLPQPTLAAGNTCRNQHWQQATPAATNTAAGNQATPAATNTGSRQHLLQPTLAAGNTCRNQHWRNHLLGWPNSDHKYLCRDFGWVCSLESTTRELDWR
jgi:serine/threonine protein kinase